MNFSKRATFNDGANMGAIAGDISSPANGDIWYNSSTGRFRKRENSKTSNLDGYIVYSITSASSPYTVTETTGHIIILVDTSGGAVTVNLPTAIGNTAMYTIKLVTAGNNLTIDPFSAETIDGSSTAVISVAKVSLDIISDNANLHII